MSKTPEASIAIALSCNTKLFKRIAPSTYCVQSPYRKSHLDVGAMLSTTREKIHVFQSVLSDSKEVDKDTEDIDDANDTHDQNYLEYNDLLQWQEMLIQQDIDVLLTNGQGSDNDLEDPTILLDGILKDQSFMEDVFVYLEQSNFQGDPTVIDDSREQILLKDLSHSAPNQSDEYIELNDLRMI